VFLAGRFRCAQAAASSAELIAAIRSIRLSRRLADSCTPRTDLAAADSGSFPPSCAVRLPAAASPFDWLPGCGSSAAGLGAAPRSGASRSSSPAMPTRVKSAYDQEPWASYLHPATSARIAPGRFSVLFPGATGVSRVRPCALGSASSHLYTTACTRTPCKRRVHRPGLPGPPSRPASLC
jgi:hypothetical protein